MMVISITERHFTGGSQATTRGEALEGHTPNSYSGSLNRTRPIQMSENSSGATFLYICLHF